MAEGKLTITNYQLPILEAQHREISRTIRIMLTLSMLIQAFPQQLWLELPPKTSEDAAQQLADYSNDVARRRAYLNQLCLHAIADELQDDPDFEGESLSVENDPSIWEWVNGAALQLGDLRLVLIPSESTDTEELLVPWEWLDIPGWSGDYYLGVQINVESEENWLRVWGFSSHAAVKAGRKNNTWRTYEVARSELRENLNLLWAGRTFNVQKEKSEVGHRAETNGVVSPKEAQRWLEQLGKPTTYSPRLEVPFERWAALLADDKWRQALYRKRLGKEEPKKSIDLKQWLQQAMNTAWEGWQGVEELLVPLEPSAVRSVSTLPEEVTPEAIAPILELLQPDKLERERTQAAGVLGNIGRGHPVVVEALAELLHTARDEETRWQAALSLGKLHPDHPQAGVKKARLVDLGMQLGEHPIALIVAIMPQTNGRIGVWVQVQPAGGQGKLPPRLQLSILSEGKTRLTVESRADERGVGKDKSIERRFSPPPGTPFQVRVSLGDAIAQEEFLV